MTQFTCSEGRAFGFQSPEGGDQSSLTGSSMPARDNMAGLSSESAVQVTPPQSFTLNEGDMGNRNVLSGHKFSVTIGRNSWDVAVFPNEVNDIAALSQQTGYTLPDRELNHEIVMAIKNNKIMPLVEHIEGKLVKDDEGALFVPSSYALLNMTVANFIQRLNQRELDKLTGEKPPQADMEDVTDWDDDPLDRNAREHDIRERLKAEMPHVNEEDLDTLVETEMEEEDQAFYEGANEPASQVADDEAMTVATILVKPRRS